MINKKLKNLAVFFVFVILLTNLVLTQELRGNNIENQFVDNKISTEINNQIEENKIIDEKIPVEINNQVSEKQIIDDEMPTKTETSENKINFEDKQGKGTKEIIVEESSSNYHEDNNLDNKLVSMKNHSGEKASYHPDHLGSTTLVTNQSGDVVEDNVYLPFGDIYSGIVNSRFLFTGKERDEGTGFDYFGARYYYAPFMHFLEVDPNIPNIYEPQDLNRYAYTRNNPYKYTDPDGNIPVLVVTAAVGAGIGAASSIAIQYYSTGQVNWGDVGKSALVGGVAGLTGFGVGAAVTSALGSGTAAAIASGATAGFASGEAAEFVSTEIISGQDYEFDPTRALFNTAFGGAVGGVGYKVGSAIQAQKLSTLSKEAQQTIKQIETGKIEGLNPHVFENRLVDGKVLLPKSSDPKYYTAYDVKIPGATNRGAQRFVIGKNGEIYYTKNHYKSFSKVSGGSKKAI